MSEVCEQGVLFTHHTARTQTKRMMESLPANAKKAAAKALVSHKDTFEASSHIRALVDRDFQREMDAERREARRAARLRVRARSLLEAAEAAMAAIPAERDIFDGPPTLRPMSALELGLMYAWMQADERQCAENEEHVTRWWSGGAVGIQQKWELASGWYDEELDAPPEGHSTPISHGRRPSPAVASTTALTTAASSGTLAIINRHLGPDAARSSAAPARGPHFLGAFVHGHRAPVAFVATREQSRTDAAMVAWTIDAMGTRLAARGRGLGSALAKHCIASARAADPAMMHYRIDVVPSAVPFWEKLGFEEAEPSSAEQKFFMKRGGDRPMALAVASPSVDR